MIGHQRSSHCGKWKGWSAVYSIGIVLPPSFELFEKEKGLYTYLLNKPIT